MGLFHLIEQHHAVGAFAHRLGQDPALAVADVARRRTLQLADSVRLLVLGEIDGDQRFLAAEQRIGQGERRFRFAGAARPDQQEHPLRTVLRRQAGFRGAQAPGNSAQGRLLANHPFAETLFQAQQLRLLIFH